MAFKLPNIKSFAQADAKTRVLVVLGTVILAALGIFFGSRFLGGDGAITGGTKVGAAPTLRSIPGGDLTPEYSRALMQANTQAAKQAQMTGGSAVPTLINTGDQSAALPSSTSGESSCKIMCPNDDSLDVGNDVANLVKANKLSQDDGARLVELSRRDASVAEFNTGLNSLLRENKITPQDARQLLVRYKKQRDNMFLAESGRQMDGLVKSGRLSLAASEQLLALQKNKISPQDYEKELSAMVRANKLKPADANALIAQYSQSRGRELAQESNFALQQLARSGAIPGAVADELGTLQSRNAPVPQYNAALQRFVAAGKMTPETANGLLDQYKTQRAGTVATGSLDALIKQQENALASQVDEVAGRSKLTADSQKYANDIKKLLSSATSNENAAQLLQQFTTQEAATATTENINTLKKLVTSRAISSDVANQLATLAEKNVPLNEYAATLNDLVSAGELNPQRLDELLSSYRVQHSKAMLLKSATGMTDLIQSGDLTPDVTSYMLALQRDKTSPEEYIVEGERLVNDRKLSAPAAEKTSAQYVDQLAQDAAGSAAIELNKMVTDGDITPALARQLAIAQSKLPTPDEYSEFVNGLVKDGKIYPETATKLISQYTQQANIAGVKRKVDSGVLAADAGNDLSNIASRNASSEDYQRGLNLLVQRGKITPQQASELLRQYTAQQIKASGGASAYGLQRMIDSQEITAEVGQTLKALQKQHVTPKVYGAELNKLVNDNKITPETAKNLLDQYTLDTAQTTAALRPLQQLVDAGELTLTDAKDLSQLQTNNIGTNEYGNKLTEMVQANKITSQTAKKLLTQYQKIQSEKAVDIELKKLVDKGVITQPVAKQLSEFENTRPTVEAYATELRRLAASQQLPASEATKILDRYRNKIAAQSNVGSLIDMQKQNVTPAQYTQLLNKLVQDKKIKPEDAQKLLATYQQYYGLKVEGQRLAQLQGDNASAQKYSDELKRAVQSRLITPDMAADLQAQYQALSSQGSVIAGSAPSIDVNVPGGSDLAKLQQRMQSQVSTSPNLAGSNINNEKFALAASEAEAAAMQEKQKRITQMQSAMSQQAQSLIKSWDFVPMSHQGSVAPDKSATESAKEAKEAAEKKAESDKEKSARPLVKAGTVLFAVLETAVDSDYPNTPVMATIVNGKLKGAKLLGKLSGLSANQDKVSLIFTLIDKDEWDKTKTINAFAIDPDTARTVLASNVNYHYLMRYGSMFAASFVSGYANAIQSSGSTTTPSIFGTTTVSKPLSAGSKIAVGLGQIGTTLSSQVSNNFNTPPTVKVDAGVGIGILFMADLS